MQACAPQREVGAIELPGGRLQGDRLFVTRIGVKEVGAPLPGLPDTADGLGARGDLPLVFVLQNGPRVDAAEPGDPVGIGAGFELADTGQGRLGEEVEGPIQPDPKPVSLIVPGPEGGTAVAPLKPTPSRLAPKRLVFIAATLDESKIGAVGDRVAVDPEAAQFHHLGRLFIVERGRVSLGADTVVALGYPHEIARRRQRLEELLDPVG